MSRGFAGVTRLRRKLRHMDDEITRDIKVQMESGAQAIERDMVGGAPVDEGDLVRSISYKMGRDGFTALIGPEAESVQIKKGFSGPALKFTQSGDLTAATQRNLDSVRNLYKALWTEFGTKSGDDGSHSAPARPFIQPAYDANKDQLVRDIRRSVAKALRSASDG